MQTRPVLLSIVVLLALVAGACGTTAEISVVLATPEPDAAADAEATATPEPAATEAPAPTATPQPTAAPDPTATDVPVPTVTPIPPPDPDLPGEPFDFLVPVDGELVGVIGVAFDDILEVHALPGENSPIVGELPNLADDVSGTGEGRELPASIWWRIHWNGIEGWVGQSFMARIGATIDVTTDVFELSGAETIADVTMLGLGMQVADLLKSVDPPSLVVVSVAPIVGAVGEFGEITMDVVGFGDDALKGFRLHVFAEPLPASEAFRVTMVEATLLCTRGLSEDGSCT